MCIDIKYEKLYGLCFDNLRMDLGHGLDKTVQAYLLEWDICVVDEDEFGRKFLDFLEEMHKSGLIQPMEVK